MLRVTRLPRSSFFQGMTWGWILGVIFYFCAVLGLYHLGEKYERDLAPCLLRQVTEIPCPLCGGTSATIALAQAKLGSAFLENPLVTITLPLIAIWVLLWVGFGIKIEPALPKRLAIALVATAVIANWIYLLQK